MLYCKVLLCPDNAVPLFYQSKLQDHASVNNGRRFMVMFFKFDEKGNWPRCHLGVEWIVYCDTDM